MGKIILTQLSIEEFRQIIREELTSILHEFEHPSDIVHQEEIMDIEAAANFLKLSKSYLYKLTSNMNIPRFKRGKRLYFKRSELIEWIFEGKLKTIKDIETEVTTYLARSKKN